MSRNASSPAEQLLGLIFTGLAALVAAAVFIRRIYTMRLEQAANDHQQGSDNE